MFGSDVDKAKVLNEYFPSVFAMDGQNVSPVVVVRENTLKVIDFDVVGVLEVLCKQTRQCSFGPGGIPPIVYRNLAAVPSLPSILFFETVCLLGLFLPYGARLLYYRFLKRDGNMTPRIIGQSASSVLLVEYLRKW